MATGLNIVERFDKNELPNIYKSLLGSFEISKEEIKHSIVDLSKNKIYHLIFPAGYDGSGDNIIESSEIWDKSLILDSKDIPIGNSQVIKWVELDWKNVDVEYIDDVILPLEPLFNQLEVACVRECCGIDAFSFKTELITMTAAKLDLPFTDIIDKIITKVETLKSVAIGLSALNHCFEKSVFINLST